MTKKKKDFSIGIKVLGIGGSGGNIVSRLSKSKKIKGIEFFAINTDLQALRRINGVKKIQIGKNLTNGLGTGMNPELGKKAAEESAKEIEELLKGAQMVFLTSGLGGGTGSGATPVIAEISKKLGILTIAVLTTPFSFEGKVRKEIAEQALKEIKEKVDSFIVISNDRLLDIAGKNTSLIEAFSLADNILKNAIINISEIILLPGLINIDFADIRTIMEGSGQALIGIGRASGEERAVTAARQAIENPLLDLTLSNAKGILFLVKGGKDLTLDEINEAAKIITSKASEEAKIIFGAIIDENLKEDFEITVIASNFSVEKEEKKEFVPLSTFKEIEKEIKEEKKEKEEEDLEIPAFLRKKIKY
jgi:cell division protein FtsZ